MSGKGSTSHGFCYLWLWGYSSKRAIGVTPGPIEWHRALIFLTAFIAVFISSGLYIGALSYKIFFNAAFLEHFSTEFGQGERLISKYRDKHREILLMETTTIGLIYATLAILVGIFLSYAVGTAIWEALYDIDGAILVSIMCGRGCWNQYIFTVILLRLPKTPGYPFL